MKQQITIADLSTIDIESQIAFKAVENGAIMKLQKSGNEHWGFVNLNHPSKHLNKNNSTGWTTSPDFTTPTGACKSVLTKFPEIQLFKFNTFSDFVAWAF